MSACVRILVVKVAVAEVFLRVLRFSLFSIIPSMLHTFLHLLVALTRKRTLENF
jgi:hypothetical protein